MRKSVVFFKYRLNLPLVAGGGFDVYERTGIVIELKYADDGNLAAAYTEALKQIEEKKYAEGLKHQGMKEIIKYGIAFCEKECIVVMA